MKHAKVRVRGHKFPIGYALIFLGSCNGTSIWNNNGTSNGTEFDASVGCNDWPIEAPKTLCVTCTVTMDSSMNPVFGHRDCWFANTE